jgi:hypothetical protein
MILKVDGVRYYDVSGESFVSCEASHMDEAVPEKSYTIFDFIVNMLCNTSVCCGDRKDARCNMTYYIAMIATNTLTPDLSFPSILKSLSSDTYIYRWEFLAPKNA